jgi:hypothetical protein
MPPVTARRSVVPGPRPPIHPHLRWHASHVTAIVFLHGALLYGQVCSRRSSSSSVPPTFRIHHHLCRSVVPSLPPPTTLPPHKILLCDVPTTYPVSLPQCTASHHHVAVITRCTLLYLSTDKTCNNSDILNQTYSLLSSTTDHRTASCPALPLISTIGQPTWARQGGPHS